MDELLEWLGFPEIKVHKLDDISEADRADPFGWGTPFDRELWQCEDGKTTHFWGMDDQESCQTDWYTDDGSYDSTTATIIDKEEEEF